MQRKILVLIIFFFSYNAYSQYPVTFTGCVKDDSGEKLIGANIIVKELNKGVVSGIDGCFKLKIYPGKYTVVVTYIGYNGYSEVLDVTENFDLQITLTESSEMLEAVRIVSEAKDVNVKEITMSTEKLEIKTIDKLPVVLGEPDVIKTIKLLPGVIMSNEASGGFHVRGGAADQNLVLLDGANVYNPSHFVGFFSVFNSDVLDDLELIKGGIPAEYGGRLSSVLDLKLKEGDYNKYHSKVSIGTISSRLFIEGPIVDDKLSFVVAARRTYADLMLALSNNGDLEGSSLNFYDLNGKTDWRINKSNRVSLSGYFGRDNLGFQDFYDQNYGNGTATLKWSHSFNSNLYFNTSINYIDYVSAMKFKGFDGNEFKLATDLADWQFKFDASYRVNEKHFLDFGLSAITHEVNPGTVTSYIGDSVLVDDVTNKYSNEYGIYISDKINLGTKLAIQLGLRYSLFYNRGTGVSYIYDKTDPQEYAVVDSLIYSKGQVFNLFPNGLEPRIGIRYMINDNTSVKLSYNRMYQYIQLASNTTGTFSLEYWFSSSPNIKPQIADQVAAGFFKNFLNHQFETSVEVFYKTVQNSVDFRDHANLLFNEQFEAELRSGENWAYGAEFMLKKRSGKFTGWISYTYSRSFKKIPEVNEGKTYSAAHDKPHDFAIVLSYDLTPRWNISGNWVYTSAEPRTVPNQKFEYNEIIAPTFGDRNSIRLFDYHRLDLAATFRFNKQPTRFEHSLSLSAYNVYNRANPYSYRFTEDPEVPDRMKAEKMYIYGFVPALSYQLKF